MRIVEGVALARAHPCAGALPAGPAAAAFVPFAAWGMPLAVAGYLAGSAIGPTLVAGGVSRDVRVEPTLMGAPATAALFAGLAQGLARTAPAGTLLRVGGAGPGGVWVRLDAARPGALAVWRVAGEGGRCGVSATALADRLRTQRPVDQAALIACTLEPPDAAAEGAMATARERLMAGLMPDPLPDYAHPPLAVAPYARAGQPGRP